MKRLCVLIACLLSMSAFSYTRQAAKISEFYVRDNGDIAIKLQGGFSDAVKQECPSNNGYAGIRDSEPLIKSFILAQYAANREVHIGVSGCSGAWLRILDVRGF